VVASIDGWRQDPELVLKFYNERRKQLENAQPNAAHKALAKLEEKYEVQIITQNVDNLHERAGSKHVLHLHGLLTQARSSIDVNLVYDIGYKEIHIGDLCEKGSQLRPNIVWFGEAVPLITTAAEICSDADIFVVIGTSLVVYPAAGLIDEVPRDATVIVIDPVKPQLYRSFKEIYFIEETASNGADRLFKKLMAENSTV
ncbi:MAG TPA: Sir2 family NAD-dependent protein deacetylase, partial [Ignavibacteria bacterium]|nr:Sir2 family NAD-dependent protein deacetylase [Ignavibacteria bacterium]